MNLKTISATLALLGSTTMAGCGEAKTAAKTEVKTEVKEVKAEDAKEVAPAAAAGAAVKGEMKCGEGKCGGEGACGGKKTDDEGAAIPVDAVQDADAKPADKPADKS